MITAIHPLWRYANWNILVDSTTQARLSILGSKLRSARRSADRERKRQKRSITGAKETKVMTQADVAIHLGISQSYLSKIEKGLQEPGCLLVESMCAYYGIKMTQVATMSDEERSQAHNMQFAL
jgi:transcriptional regulator with XRE-family HTH domain